MAKRNRLSVAQAVLACSLLSLTMAVPQVNTPAAAQGRLPDNGSGGISMTMHQVVKGQGGQEFFLDRNQKALPLPGAGVTSPTVAIYSAPSGAQWYVDRTGTKQTLPSSQFSAGNQYYDEGSTPAPAAGTVQSLNTGVPLGVPMYWNQSGPYYYSSAGAPVNVTRNVNNVSQLSEFNQQSANWTHTSNNYWGHNTWNHNNWEQHWGARDWPGKEHGFPPPNDRSSGRLYADNNEALGHGDGRQDRDGVGRNDSQNEREARSDDDRRNGGEDGRRGDDRRNASDRNGAGRAGDEERSDGGRRDGEDRQGRRDGGGHRGGGGHHGGRR